MHCSGFSRKEKHALHRIDQLSLYLEGFSFKLCAAWSDRLENYISGAQKHNKHNLHVYILYINAIISYSFRVCSQHCALMNATMFYIIVIVKVLSTAAAIGWTIARGPTEIAEHKEFIYLERRHPSWLTHSRSPAAWNLRQYCLFFTQYRRQYAV